MSIEIRELVVSSFYDSFFTYGIGGLLMVEA
jgi:hypothetical protein